MSGSFVLLFSIPDTYLLWTKNLNFYSSLSKGDYIYNFTTGKFDHLMDTPIRDRYLQFVESKNAYLNLHKQLLTTKFFTDA